jgi:virulence-associated protein VapD
MYAIAFDLVVDDLRRYYDAHSPHRAYAEIRAVLLEEGFTWQQGSVYFGDPDRVNGPSCVSCARRLAHTLPWFSKCVRDIQMLRIEENADLNGVVQRTARGEMF